MELIKKHFIKVLDEVQCFCGEKDELVIDVYTTFLKTEAIEVRCLKCDRISDTEIPTNMYVRFSDEIQILNINLVNEFIKSINEHFDKLSPLQIKFKNETIREQVMEIKNDKTMITKNIIKERIKNLFIKRK